MEVICRPAYNDPESIIFNVMIGSNLNSSYYICRTKEGRFIWSKFRYERIRKTDEEFEREVKDTACMLKKKAYDYNAALRVSADLCQKCGCND